MSPSCGAMIRISPLFSSLLLACPVEAAFGALSPWIRQLDLVPAATEYSSKLLLAAVNGASPDDDDVQLAASALRSVTFSNLRKEQEPQLLCDFLMELGACSTSITDADRDTEHEQAIFQEPIIHGDDDAWQAAAVVCGDAAVGCNVWNRCNVTAHFPASTDLSSVANMVQETLQIPLEMSLVESVPDRDWVVHVQQSWKPILISGILLRFPWHSDEDVRAAVVSDAEVVELQLEGGIAFGTGEHPTTQLCLMWIQNLLREQDSNIVNFMDYGAGSGILGLAACALSDQIMAVGVDIDVDAVRIANANAVTNGLSMFNFLPPLTETNDDESKSVLMKAHQKRDSGVEVLPEASNKPIYDALVANILAGPLVTLASTLAGLLRPNGHLGLSGILKSQAYMVMDAYSEYFDNISVEREMEGWVLITARRKL